jgi:hypothetical protein
MRVIENLAKVCYVLSNPENLRDDFSFRFTDANSISSFTHALVLFQQFPFFRVTSVQFQD